MAIARWENDCRIWFITGGSTKTREIEKDTRVLPRLPERPERLSLSCAARPPLSAGGSQLRVRLRIEAMSIHRYHSLSVRLAAIALFSLAVSRNPIEAQSSTSAKELGLKKKEIELKQKEVDLDKKQVELDQLKQQLKYDESAQSISINLQGDVLFDFGKAIVRAEAEPSLEKVAVVGAFPEGKTKIVGYTDAKGSPKENLTLSKKRAQAVKDWLVGKKGLPEGNISIDGLGEENPVALNKNPDGSDNPEGRAQNRRVTITVEK